MKALQGIWLESFGPVSRIRDLVPSPSIQPMPSSPPLSWRVRRGRAGQSLGRFFERANSFTPLISRPAAQNQVWDRLARAAAGGVAWPGPPGANPNLRPNSNSNSRGNSRSGTPVQRVIPTSVARANSSTPGALGWTRAPKERNVVRGTAWAPPPAQSSGSTAFPAPNASNSTPMPSVSTGTGTGGLATAYSTMIPSTSAPSSNQAPSHAFPALPTTSQKYKPVIGGVNSARRIGGGGNVPASPWGGSESNVAQGASNEQGDGDTNTGDGEGNNGEGNTGKGKKGKGKQKQMLFTTSFRAVG
ncbi:hypothetical protein C8J56DRAFT_1126812 [Mycena floridula]|nr:hypothetical protein C8J56DRAFT_1126812 [Mycena floridula]